MAELLAQGYLVFMVTATVSHHLGDHLADVMRLVRGGWSKLWQGGAGTRWRRSFGYVGAVVSDEVTYGLNGWHPHVHALLVFSPGSPVTVEALHGLGRRFGHGVARLGGWCDVDGAGWNVSAVAGSEAVAQYLTKVQESDGWSAGLELARGDLKAAKRQGVKPFDLLHAAAVDGDLWAAGMWRIYEEATIGRRLLRWSPGLKDLALVDDVQDDELAAGDPEDVIVAEWFVPSDVWNRWLLHGELGERLNWFQTAQPGESWPEALSPP